jgi:hypothetical protein
MEPELIFPQSVIAVTKDSDCLQVRKRGGVTGEGEPAPTMGPLPF